MTGRSSLISKGKTQYHAIHFSRTSLLQNAVYPFAETLSSRRANVKESPIAAGLRALLNRNKKGILVLREEVNYKECLTRE